MKERASVFFYLNGKKVEVKGSDAFLPLANFLRKNCGLPGTKIVCAEGDCGACSVMIATPSHKAPGKMNAFRMINSCIAPVFLLDAAFLLTVEALHDSAKELSQVQEALVSCHGSQCGFCTPGFVVALSSLVEDWKEESKEKITSQDVKNYCTGNLCRCTGYDPIVKAGLSLNPAKWESLKKRFLSPEVVADLVRLSKDSLHLTDGQKHCFAPTQSKDVSRLLRSQKGLRIVSSATDLGVLHNKEKIDLYQVLTLQKIPELYECKENSRELRVGAKVDLETLRLTTKKIFPDFSKFLNIFASLQIRNVATLVGNVANASPIGDTLPFLFVSEAQVEIQGAKKRLVPMTSFYKGYKKTDLKAGEWISAIIIPKLTAKAQMKFYKISQRRDLDISTVSAAFLKDKSQLKIAYGGVAPTTLRLKGVERFLQGKELSAENVRKAQDLLKKEIAPLSDARATKEFRLLVSANLFAKFIAETTR